MKRSLPTFTTLSAMLVAGACYSGPPDARDPNAMTVSSDSLGTSSATATGDGDGDPSSTTTSSTTTSSTTSSTTTGDGDGDPTTSTTTGGDGDGDPDPTTTGGDGDGDPPPLGSSCPGYATRFWDCCKPHCSWEENVPPGATPVGTCNEANQSNGNDWSVPNSCQQPNANAGYTCFDMAPWEVNPNLAYGFAAVPANGDICGRCYQLEFDGTGHYSADDPGSVALGGKTMIVQAVNIGFDVQGGQFDILIPGGGVGAFNACSAQWNVGNNELGATYGGLLTVCQQQNGDNFGAIKQCVLDRCNSIFDEPNHGDLMAGCEWFVNWFETADNPNLDYQEVECPQSLINVSGIERPEDDIEGCGGGGECSQEQMDMCDCSWTNGGQNCGGDDGSCCWQACCG